MLTLLGNRIKDRGMMRSHAHALKTIALCFMIATSMSSNRALAGEVDAPTLEALLAPTSYWSLRLSPSGTRFAALRYFEDSGYEVEIRELDNPDAEPIRHSMDLYYANFVDWVSDDRLIISLTGFEDTRRDKLMAAWAGEVAKHYDVRRFDRLIGMDVSGENRVTMFGERSSDISDLGDIVHRLPNEPDHVLMAGKLNGKLDLFRVNVRNGSHTLVASGSSNTKEWFADREGYPAFRYDVNRSQTVLSIFVRTTPVGETPRWKKLRTINLKQSSPAWWETQAEFRLLRAGPTPQTYFILTRAENDDLAAIWLYDFVQDRLIQKISSVEGYDASGGLFDTRSGNFIGTVYWSDGLELDIVDDRVQAALDGLSSRLDDSLNLMPINAETSGQKWIVRSGGPTDPGTYYVFDLANSSHISLGSSRPQLERFEFATTEVVHYEARDGLALRGYLTRPNSAKPGDTPPLIMMPHGGPEARDYLEFDSMIQFLAGLGYQVFQPQFRGSDGFGRRFARLGYRQWGKAMQTDIDDALAHLVAEDIVHKDRACIMGGSYGGYAALTAAHQQPDAYRCIIAIAGVSDLIEQLKWAKLVDKETGGGVYSYWTQHIGDPRSNKKELVNASPITHFAKISSPILFIHGSRDWIVYVEQSRNMYNEVAQSVKGTELLTFRNAGHSYRTGEERRIEYQRIAKFLNTHLPVESASDGP
jgi:dipeptidyl aminopeptidase/acylaminoacyl peptidase